MHTNRLCMHLSIMEYLGWIIAYFELNSINKLVGILTKLLKNNLFVPFFLSGNVKFTNNKRKLQISTNGIYRTVVACWIELWAINQRKSRLYFIDIVRSLNKNHNCLLQGCLTMADPVILPSKLALYCTPVHV